MSEKGPSSAPNRSAAPDGGGVAVEVSDVRIRYGAVEAIKGITFATKPGVITALIGSNGAGKSTTLRAISGLTPIASGYIRFLGQRIDTLPTARIIRLGIAHCPEGRRVFPKLTVVQNLNMGAYLQTDSRAVSETREEIFARFPILRERANQRAGTLSGGQQQMLAIGRALMAQPKLLLLDEPSLGLSPLLVKEISEIIGSINRHGVAVILVEQNASMALDLAQEGYVFETGRIALGGPANELKENEIVKRAYLGG